MGEMKATTFVRLLELLVKSVHCMGLKYGGVELSLGLWRRCRCGQLESFWEWGGAIHQPNGQKTNRKNPQTLTPAVHVRTRVNNYASCAYKRPEQHSFTLHQTRQCRLWENQHGNLRWESIICLSELAFLSKTFYQPFVQCWLRQSILASQRNPVT